MSLYCEAVYGNEKEVGSALKDAFASGLRREDVFITSKLWNTKHKSEDVRYNTTSNLNSIYLFYFPPPYNTVKQVLWIVFHDWYHIMGPIGQ